MEKKEGYLKLIILYKTVMGFVEILISVSLLNLLGKDIVSIGLRFAYIFNLDIDNRYISSAIDQLGMLGNNHIMGLSAGVLVIGVLNLVESYGLHMRMRWAEWLTIVATSVFIPFEAYKVIIKVTPLMVGVLVINCAIVYYLAKHKELFRSRKEAKVDIIET